MRPDRSGVPAKAIFDRADGAVRDLDRSTDLHFPTLLARLQERGLTTGSVLSKKFLYGIFGARASYRWEPQPLLPVPGHLKNAGNWDSSVVMVLADHSMDWSIPSNVISINLILQSRPELQSNITVAQNGGADLLYWTGPESDRAAGLAAVEQLVRAHEACCRSTSRRTSRRAPRLETWWRTAARAGVFPTRMWRPT